MLTICFETIHHLGIYLIKSIMMRRASVISLKRSVFISLKCDINTENKKIRRAKSPSFYVYQ